MKILDNQLAKTEILFAQDFLEKNFETNLVKLKAYGLSITSEFARPVLLLKDDKGDLTLPVALSPIEAGLAISQSNKHQMPSSPHEFTKMLIESLGLQITRAVFCEIKGHYQFLKVFIKNHPSQEYIIVRADQVMSLLLHLNVDIFASREFVNGSRILNAEMDGITKGTMANPHVLHNGRSFIM